MFLEQVINSAKVLGICWLVIIRKHIVLPMGLAQIRKGFKEAALAEMHFIPLPVMPGTIPPVGRQGGMVLLPRHHRALATDIAAYIYHLLGWNHRFHQHVRIYSPGRG